MNKKYLKSTMMRKTLFLCLLFVGSLTAMQAQRLEVGVLGGYTVYSGDLSRSEFGLYFEDAGLAYGVFARYDIAKMVSAKLSINYAEVMGDDANGSNPQRDLNFRTDVFEISLIGELNLYGVAQANDNFLFVPYLFGGVGLFNFNPEGRFEDTFVELQPLGTEGQGLPGYEAPYQLTQIMVPLGIGGKMTINNKITIGFEIGARKLFTDHFDDISAAEVNYRDILRGNGTLAAQLSNKEIDPNTEVDVTYIRGGDANDWYFISGLSVAFRLNSGSRGGTPLDCFKGF